MTPFTGDKPQRNDRTTFSSRVDAFITWLLDTFWDELQTVVLAFNFNATNSTSTTSLAISVASKSLTVQAGKSYVPGMALTIAYTTDPTQWMRGEVLTYDSGTGAMTFNARVISTTTGTYAAWTISQAAVEAVLRDNYFRCHTPNGHGSTNNKIRLMTTTEVNVGTAFTITHSATLGTYVTINEAGLYQFSYSDLYSAGVGIYGVSVNSNQLTQSVSSITLAHRRALVYQAPSGASFPCLTEPIWLVAGDVVRPHTNGSPDSVTDFGMFKGCKLANAA